MKSSINNFWNYFVSIQEGILDAHNGLNLKVRDHLFDKLVSKAVKIHPKLNLIISFYKGGQDSVKLIFLTKGDYKLKAIGSELIAVAPRVEHWQYEIGIQPYKNSIITLCAENKFIDPYTTVFQIYFAVQKVYKTSNKLHLLIYLEMNKQHSKSDLHFAMDSIFTWFLGDELYCRHISRYKIIRRKYSAFNFIPFDELRSLLQFKNLN